jgi:hypothetical protein
MLNNRTLWDRFRGLAAAISCSVLLGVALTPRAAADVADKKTIVTFNAPVEVPGKVLPPGTYVFKLMDAVGPRNVVQIFDKDQKQLYATILAVPNYRLDPPEKPIISFQERPSGSPEAIKAWFYPGDTYGAEFVYPHKRAVELAKRTNQNVLSMRDEMTNNMAAPNKSASDSSVKELENTEVTGSNPSGEPIDLVIVVAPSPETK